MRPHETLPDEKRYFKWTYPLPCQSIVQSYGRHKRYLNNAAEFPPVNTCYPNLPAAKSLQCLAVHLLYIPRIKQSAIGKHNSSAPQKRRLKPCFPSGDPAELRDIIQTPFLPFGVCCLPLYSDKHCTLRRYVYFRDFEHNAFV